jgi:hypothetical protein
MDFNSQFSILNSVSRFEIFQPIAVLAAARYCSAATTYSILALVAEKQGTTEHTEHTER